MFKTNAVYVKEAKSPYGNYSNEMKIKDLKYTQIFEMLVKIKRLVFSECRADNESFTKMPEKHP